MEFDSDSSSLLRDPEWASFLSRLVHNLSNPLQVMLHTVEKAQQEKAHTPSLLERSCRRMTEMLESLKVLSRALRDSSEPRSLEEIKIHFSRLQELFFDSKTGVPLDFQWSDPELSESLSPSVQLPLWIDLSQCFQRRPDFQGTQASAEGILSRHLRESKEVVWSLEVRIPEGVTVQEAKLSRLKEEFFHWGINLKCERKQTS
jgi:hypothetical protein